MPVFAWRRRATRHFGEQWVPFAEISLKASSGRWYAFSLQVDTGAVISVVPRSAGDLLGIETSRCEHIDLPGVGESRRRYSVHRLPARIGDLSEFQLRIAIGESEQVPSLLGRLDVLDCLQIDFDVSLEETRFTSPWLDSAGRRIWRHLLETEDTILKKWIEYLLPGRVDEAARRFINRAGQLVAAGAGLLKLHRDFELPLLIRSLFELAIQFEYLMQDPETRSELYLDYEHVSRYRIMSAWASLPGPVGDTLRASPRRVEGEKRSCSEYDRVRGQFPRKKGSADPRWHWYPGTLRALAEDVGRKEEYDAVFGLYSAWAHGCPWISSWEDYANDGLMHAYCYWARVMMQVADAKKIALTSDAYRSLEELAKGITKA